MLIIMPINPELLKILNCPQCGTGPLEYRKRLRKESIYCRRCDTEYPIKNGIIVFIEQEGFFDKISSLYRRLRKRNNRIR